MRAVATRAPLRCNQPVKTQALALVGLAALAVVAAGDARAPRSELISFWTGVGTPAVWVMHSDGSRAEPGDAVCATGQAGLVSPDGLRLVLDGTRTATGPREDFDVQLVRLDGSGRRWLTHGAARDTNATWSPDGARSSSSAAWGRARRRSGRFARTARPNDGSALGSDPVLFALWTEDRLRPRRRRLLHASGRHGRAAAQPPSGRRGACGLVSRWAADPLHRVLPNSSQGGRLDDAVGRN